MNDTNLKFKKSTNIHSSLTGYGKSSKYDGDRGEFLIQLIKALSPNVNPILVSPSMSGTFSLPLLKKDPDLICGYIPGKY